MQLLATTLRSSAPGALLSHILSLCCPHFRISRYVYEIGTTCIRLKHTLLDCGLIVRVVAWIFVRVEAGSACSGLACSEHLGPIRVHIINEGAGHHGSGLATVGSAAWFHQELLTRWVFHARAHFSLGHTFTAIRALVDLEAHFKNPPAGDFVLINFDRFLVDDRSALQVYILVILRLILWLPFSTAESLWCRLKRSLRRAIYLLTIHWLHTWLFAGSSGLKRRRLSFRLSGGSFRFITIFNCCGRRFDIVPFWLRVDRLRTQKAAVNHVNDNDDQKGDSEQPLDHLSMLEDQWRQKQ